MYSAVCGQFTFLSDKSFLYPLAPRLSRVMSTSRDGEADARPVGGINSGKGKEMYNNKTIGM